MIWKSSDLFQQNIFILKDHSILFKEGVDIGYERCLFPVKKKKQLDE